MEGVELVEGSIWFFFVLRLGIRGLPSKKDVGAGRMRSAAGVFGVVPKFFSILGRFGVGRTHRTVWPKREEVRGDPLDDSSPRAKACLRVEDEGISFEEFAGKVRLLDPALWFINTPNISPLRGRQQKSRHPKQGGPVLFFFLPCERFVS